MNNDDHTKFYIGLHIPAHAHKFDRVCLNVNCVRGRLKPIECDDVLLDSGAFTELLRFGCYRHEPAIYAAEIKRLHEAGILKISAAVAQDYMCEPFMLSQTGLTLIDHQRLTIERFDALVAERVPVVLLPVLQGFAPQDYVRHLKSYGERISRGAWVGVGSVCKRNSKPEQIVDVLQAILSERPDLRLHGFGVKTTAFEHPGIRSMLYSADSMAWSFAARKQGRNGNSPDEARRFKDDIEAKISRPPQWWQPSLGLVA